MTATPATAGRRSTRTVRGLADRFLIESNGAIFIALIALVVLFTVLSPNQAFISAFNIRSMVLSGASVLVLAVGATFVLISGHIDLSIGSVLVLSGVVGIDVMTRIVAAGGGDVTAIAIGILVTVGVGIGVGLANGLITTIVRIPSFIVTLGMAGIALGLAQLVSVGPLSQQVPDLMTDAIGRGAILGIPVPVIIAGAITLVAWIVLSQTRLGLSTYAIGSNLEAARRAGVPVSRLVIIVFAFMGFCAAGSAIIEMSRFTTVNVAGFTTTALAAISAVIIGGTSLFGGRGSITGTIAGVMIPVILLSGLVILGVGPFWQNIVIGTMLIVAVGFDHYQRERLARGVDGTPGEPDELEPALADPIAPRRPVPTTSEGSSSSGLPEAEPPSGGRPGNR